MSNLINFKIWVENEESSWKRALASAKQELEKKTSQTQSKDQADDSEIYEVPLDRMDLINSKLEKLNRRASKLKMPLVKLIEVGRFVKQIDREGRKYPREYLKIKVEGEAPKIEGWSFVARIMHSEGGNIINMAPGESSVPTSYRTAKPNCDHCRVSRQRNDTFILKKESEYKQIGRSCLQDFLRSTDPTDQIALLSDWNTVVQALGDDDDFMYGGGGRARTSFETLNFLATTLAVIRKFGFVPKSKSEELNKEATSSVLERIYMGTSKEDNELRTQVAAVSKPTDIDEASKILDWAKNLKNQQGEISDYIWNISVAAERLLVDSKTWGLVASIPAAYQREVDRNKPIENIDDSNITLKKGDKFEGVVTILKTPRWSNDYGVTILHIMQDDNGVVYKWKSSKEDISVGSKVLLKGSVKDVAPDKQLGKMTVELTRCKVIKVFVSDEHKPLFEEKEALVREWESICPDKEFKPYFQVGDKIELTSQQNLSIKMLDLFKEKARISDFESWYRQALATVIDFFFQGERIEYQAKTKAADAFNLNGDPKFISQLIDELNKESNKIKTLIPKEKDDQDQVKYLTKIIHEYEKFKSELPIWLEVMELKSKLTRILERLEQIEKETFVYKGRNIHKENMENYSMKFNEWLKGKTIKESLRKHSERDPFARQTTTGAPVDAQGKTCDFCGSEGKNGKLYQYTVESDGGRNSTTKGLFCCKSCFKSYNNI